MKIQRLRKNTEFRLVYRRGKSFSTDILVLYIFKNNRNTVDGQEINRVGISVSKKVGKSVVRSRVKRLISESYRLNCENISKKYDLVFVARTAAKDKSYWEIEAAMKKLFKKAGLYQNEKNTNNPN
ncbi:MAG: ribonuclease P protein component [Clostridiales bacterium]|uniref:ribonuclease P protein component n=1 Tax=Clostridium sp. N3C TaxID=1776758 RepID=UPI0009420130|nr:ribonuclease P protein component [Clostridium sp. N3C]NLZ47662.1 ribonuclease P protein component [Clostridiales bacterium]